MTSYIPVQVGEIQKELDKLEKMHEQNNQLRASLFNLIVYTRKNEKLPYFVQIVDEIVKQFPCRILFIEESSEESAPYLNAKIAAKIVSSGDNPNVVCDKIYLETSKNNSEQILHLILQHTIVDLPIYLLWGQDPTLSHPLFPSLKHIAKRLVFHSECSNNLQEMSQKLLANVIKDHWEIADLNWINLEEWKEVLKAIFNSKESVDDLNQTSEVTLKFCSSKSEFFCHNHFQVHYMHAWLAAQLQWDFVSYQDEKAAKHIHYKKNQTRIQVNILEHECSIKALPGTITYLQIKTENKKNFTFQTQYEDEMIHIEIVDEKKESPPYNTALMKSKWEVYLAKEICYEQTSQHYIQTLKVLAEIDGLV